ncbi:MAG: IS66 family insertion sequence element accessory protein TnpB [Pseudomonadota bacterium]
MKHEQPESKLAKQQYWQEHIESWKRSGLSQTEYCRLNSLRLKNFWYWKKRYSGKTSEQLRFFPLALVPAKTVGAIKSQPASLQLTLQEQRFRIEIGENFSPSVLKGLILTLEQL